MTGKSGNDGQSYCNSNNPSDAITWSSRIRLANNENASIPAKPFARDTQCGKYFGGTSAPQSNIGSNRCTSANVILPANNIRHRRNLRCRNAQRKNVCTPINPRTYTVSLVNAQPPVVGTPRNTR